MVIDQGYVVGSLSDGHQRPVDFDIELAKGIVSIMQDVSEAAKALKAHQSAKGGVELQPSCFSANHILRVVFR